jgi:hypothetical protein
MPDMYGVVDGVYFCNQDRDKELNNRIAARNIPSQPLQPQFSLRPVPTKYTKLPIVDQRSIAQVPINCAPAYNTTNVFNPGNAEGPWSGFANKINTESDLKNMFFALQNCDQSVYVPKSTSDLYNMQVTPQEVNNPHELLFHQEEFNPFNPNRCDVGKDFFNNHTRVQRLEKANPPKGESEINK